MPDRLVDAVARPLGSDGFAFARAQIMEPALAAWGLTEFTAFAASWNDLGPDTYMADGGRYRRRRFAAFRARAGMDEDPGDTLVRKPHQPHYQSTDYNPLNGGVERWFLPITETVGAHPALAAIVGTGQRVFERLTEPSRMPPAWHIEVHQFRIEARLGEEGRPTPEGMHRDGVDWVIVAMIRRENVASGVTTISDLAGRALGSFTLAEPLDAAFVDDSRVYHAVTSLVQLAPASPAYRDVLVATFRRE
jgi:hypothetical protein